MNKEHNVSVKKVIEIKELDQMDELQQEIPWNQYIPIKSVLEHEEIPGEIDEFQLKSLQKLAVLRSKGLKFNDQLMATKAFKNPCIMDKMLDYHNIDPHGSFILTELSFQKAYNDIYSAENTNQTNVQSDLSSSRPEKKDRTIQFVKSTHKSSYYDKRRRI